jgi:hypothetical protein
VKLKCEKIFIDENLYVDHANRPDHQKRVKELAKIRESRKQKLLAVYKLVRDSRNKNFDEENWLPDFTSPLDLFNNISDSLVSTGNDPEETEALGTGIEELNNQIKYFRSEFDLKVSENEQLKKRYGKMQSSFR